MAVLSKDLPIPKLKRSVCAPSCASPSDDDKEGYAETLEAGTAYYRWRREIPLRKNMNTQMWYHILKVARHSRDRIEHQKDVTYSRKRTIRSAAVRCAYRRASCARRISELT